MKKFTSALWLALLAAPMFSAQAAQTFGPAWQSPAAAASDQVQIIYYRPADLVGNGPAHIYVDGEYQAALLPGNYSRFCLAPGSHSLGSFVQDAPGYEGKRDQPWRDELGAGKTYYIRASIDGSGQPQVIARSQAESELAGLRQQIHMLSRASSVQACRQPAAAPRYNDYQISSDILFRFGGGDIKDITAEGRQAISQLAAQLKQSGEAQSRIEVIGHTDPIGQPQANLQLGQRRADTVRQMLIQQGVEADNMISQSVGSSQALRQCSGTQVQRIACHKPDRRVVVRVAQ